MKIALGSVFNNSTPYLQRYFAQVIALQEALHARDDSLYCVWGEGDSTDGTLAQLAGALFRIPGTLVDVAHGGQIFGSVAVEERFRQLAEVGRKLWAKIPQNADVVLWVESDLIWSAETALGLIDRVGTPAYARFMEADRYGYTPATIPAVAAVAPSIILHRGQWRRDTFYDVAFFVKDGCNFEHRPPWHPGNDGRAMVEMERVGSMVAFDAELLRQAAPSYDERVLGGLCDDIRALGGGVWFAADLPAVIHE